MDGDVRAGPSFKGTICRLGSPLDGAPSHYAEARFPGALRLQRRARARPTLEAMIMRLAPSLGFSFQVSAARSLALAFVWDELSDYRVTGCGRGHYDKSVADVQSDAAPRDYRLAVPDD